MRPFLALRRSTAQARGRGDANSANRTNGGENGQVSILVVGFAIVVLTLVIGVINVTAVQLARARLYDVSDAAALAAADAISDDAVYAQGLTTSLPVADARVRAEAASHLANSSRPQNVASWALGAATGAVGERAAQVELVGVVTLPLANDLIDRLGGPVTISVHSNAQAKVRRTVP